MATTITTVFERRFPLYFFLLLSFLFGNQSALFATVDAAKVLGPENCGQCHRLEFETWKKTRHYQLLDTLYKNPMAQQIAQKMGEKLIKVDSVCLNCHFTPRLMSGKLSATAGVSCESCHGAAKDWVGIHNDFGGMQSTIKTETPEHRKQRVQAVQAAGMFVPEQFYRLAGNCFQCHTVQNEKLVNTGGHPTGSSFDLVDRAKTIRHNFIRGDRKSNPEATPERKRLMYLVGYTLELEYGLRGAAQAKEDGRYLKAMSSRVKDAMTELKAMKGVLPLPELDQILNAAQGVAIKANNEAELMHAVEKISAAGIAIAENNDGKKFAALDQLMSASKEEEEPAGATSGPGQSGAAGGGGGNPDVKAHVRPPSNHKTVGPSNCSCHGPQNEWWGKDKHFGSSQPFLNDDPKRQKIARLYGVSSADMKTGKAICMDCHGTVITGKEKREVEDGVSCESCHGAGADFLKVHNEGGKFNSKAFGLGMRELEKLDIRATVCTGCHYITEPRLLSAGHPSNEGFDYAAAMDKIKHWKAANDAGAIKTAFTAEVTKRGPVPKVELAKDTGPPPAPAGGSTGGGAGGSGGGTSAPPPPAGGIVKVGQKKNHILPPPNGKVIGPGNCGGCHTPSNEWWAGDRHNHSAESFWDEKPKNVKIAAAYGISASDMKNGNNICMDCHGTIVSGKEAKEVADGVSCENCHGPAGGFIKVHNEGNKFNPKAFTLGMREVKKMDVRAALCTGCHYITDERLIAAGHRSNANFDYVKAMDKIKHWKSANDPAAIKTAFDAALAKRGAIPKVAVAVNVEEEEEPEEEESSAPPAGNLPRPVMYGQQGAPSNLPPIPTVTEKTSVEDLLKIIKKRIELLSPKKEGEP